MLWFDKKNDMLWFDRNFDMTMLWFDRNFDMTMLWIDRNLDMLWFDRNFDMPWLDRNFDMTMLWLDRNFDMPMLWLDRNFDMTMLWLDRNFDKMNLDWHLGLHRLSSSMPFSCAYLGSMNWGGRALRWTRPQQTQRISSMIVVRLGLWAKIWPKETGCYHSVEDSIMNWIWFLMIKF